MATLIYVDKENDSIPTAAPSKLRDRLYSAPGNLLPDKCLKTPFSKKVQMRTPLQSGRKALGNVNKISFTPVSHSGQKSKPLVVQAQTKVKEKPQQSGVEYPEIEKFFPYNPLDFETFQVPEEVRLSHLCLAGLGSLPPPPDLSEDELEAPNIHAELSPLRSQSDLDSFLLVVSELTVEMPPELEY